MKMVVKFSMWGQDCQTTFDTNERGPILEWMRICYDKGFMRPNEVVDEEGEVYWFLMENT